MKHDHFCDSFVKRGDFDFDFRDDTLPGAARLQGWYQPETIMQITEILQRHPHLSALTIKVNAAERAWRRLNHPEGPIVVEPFDVG
ncbi:hypothetical protein KCP91_15565 [Microvirga sp. SRT01]|uniref:Uncharacterized protein n=1 Tax=Sphingomonas longa TaxID=2778730 RepID=A0ABS2DCJ6_9SPHN|nr:MULTISPECIES: hypothetical protein [Alphaproteobacteria]MBM6577801.1 hypothetical protein [Sphingomonas sp. BT552]MBR7710843.1 hypothetical protein [Microvirga sp. SRT01]